LTDEITDSTASPFHFRVNDTKKDLLDPAINGTTGVLKAIKKYAPTVKRVVITSSFASIVNTAKGAWPGHVYSEADWNPVTVEEATRDPSTGYRASKTLAEKAAWKFVEEEKPNFTISTINPPLVSGIRVRETGGKRQLMEIGFWSGEAIQLLLARGYQHIE
jgi:nucleoside-diphosphate-sugar epimerase